MNSIKKYLTADKRRIIMNYLRPSQYYTHPELKVKGIPEKRWKMLLTMRDLRLSTIEDTSVHIIDLCKNIKHYKIYFLKIN